MVLLEQYCKDLACLQRPTILEDQNLSLWREELERARQKEEQLRRKRNNFWPGGQEEIAVVQAKAQKLGVIKRQRKQVTEELAAFLAALGQATAEEARSYLLGLKQKQEAQIAAEQNRVDLDDDELAALFGLYCDAGRFLSTLTEGKGQGLMPRLEGNLLRFSVRTAEGDWRAAEELPFGRPDLPDLAFRLALAKAVWAENQPLLLFDELVPGLTSTTKEAFCKLLRAEFRSGQIITRVR